MVFKPTDPFTTGIVYMPFGLAYAISNFTEFKDSSILVDAFGSDPNFIHDRGNFYFFGKDPESVISSTVNNTDHYIIYANQLINFIWIEEFLKKIRKHEFKGTISILENSQAVTAFNLQEIEKYLFNLGATFILTGDLEEKINILASHEFDPSLHVKGIHTTDYSIRDTQFIQDLDNLNFPGWEHFPLENYWDFNVAHGPKGSAKYLPILTSRGCPYPCKFCVVPSTNLRKWRKRSAENVVAEMEFFKTSLGVDEFHIEDLDPTIEDSRTREISKALIERQLNVKWKIVSGTKVETIKTVDTLELMGKSGCNYVSISPETGSKRILKLMKKPFSLEHAVKIIGESRKRRIETQACFVLGFPEEKTIDIIKTLLLIFRMTTKGLSEIAIFIITPVPGSAISDNFRTKPLNLSELNFSPSWRTDYRSLVIYRIIGYIIFLGTKTLMSPLRMIKSLKNVKKGVFELKMEMAFYRGVKYRMALRRYGKKDKGW